MHPTFDPSSLPVRRLLAVLAIAVALGACSRDLSAQSAAAAAAPAGGERGGDPAGERPGGGRRGARTAGLLELVERYGPAVVNVEVVEKPQPLRRRRAGTVAQRSVL